MIPADLASRLRVLLESSVQPAAQVQEIPAGLPRFEAGDRFSALIQAALPEGSFQALVAGKTVTLALPESARSGDVLELVVTAQRGDTVFARLASPAVPQTFPGEAQPHPVLSQTGQLISQLLTGRFGENAPTPLNATGMPLTAAPQNASELAGTLKQAISSSGLFYESHLRQWVDGKLPLAAVQQEPQAQHPPLSSQATALPFGTDTGADPLQPSGTQPPSGTGNGLHSGSETDPRLQTKAGLASHLDERAGSTVSASVDSSDGAGKSGGSRSVAEPLMPIVQRQLDTLATHQMSWQGQVWPGVQMQWDIFDPEEYASRQQGGEEDDSAKFWRSALRLSMPNLGNVEVQLVLSPQGLKISIDTDSQASADDIRGAGPNLQESLEASGVHLLQLKVSKHEPA
jgi:hypothetical protein